jgi:hypothetical protein
MAALPAPYAAARSSTRIAQQTVDEGIDHAGARFDPM